MIDGDTAFATTGLTIAEIGTTGWWELDIDATRMTSRQVKIEVRATNANAHYWARTIVPEDYTESTTRALDQTVFRVGQLHRQSWMFQYNENYIDRTAATYSVYNDAGTTVLYTGPGSDNGTIAIRGKLS